VPKLRYVWMATVRCQDTKSLLIYLHCDGCTNLNYIALAVDKMLMSIGKCLSKCSSLATVDELAERRQIEFVLANVDFSQASGADG